MQNIEYKQNLDAFYSLSSAPKAELLREVYELETDGCLEALALVFTTKVLTFKANEDDDTITIRSGGAKEFGARRSFRKSRSPVWKSFIGKSFGWGWITVNQQGYCDGALLSFDGLTPGVLLEVVASSIKMSTVTSQSAPHEYGFQLSENAILHVRKAGVMGT